jgi:hypothetical protein
VAQRNLQRGKFGPTQVVRDDKDGNWYSVSQNLDTGEEVRKPLGGTPLSSDNVSQRDADAAARQEKARQEAFTQRQALQASADKYAKDRIRLQASLRAAQQARSATDPSLMIMRRYKVLGGDTVSQQIQVQSGIVASMEKNAAALGLNPTSAPGLKEAQDKLAALYKQHDKIMASATAQQAAPAAAAAPKKSGGPIQVTTEDLAK